MISEKIKDWLGDIRAKVEPTEDLANGDYTTNFALVLKKDAKILKTELEKNLLPEIARIEVAGPGFLNFYLTEKAIVENLKNILKQKDKYGWNEKLKNQKVIIEYTDPNPFKEFHVGHLMSNAIGESISRLIEAGGAEVKRACYQGDVGLHVAKAIWADGDYALGFKKYEEDEQAKKEIQEINKKIYNQSDEKLNKLYETGKKASLKSFEKIYEKLGTKFDHYFFEGEAGEFGRKIVADNIDGVFEKSDGAIIFRAEKYNPKLHTRVFISSDGLPTYEAKELGLAQIKFEQYPHDQSLVVTGNEINQYFQVLLQALKLIFPALAKKTRHVSHGMLRLPAGKMSSRTGEVITAESLLAEVKTRAPEKITDDIAVAAVKYTILKQAPGRDVIFDPTKSISLTGDSGPYLQYTYARARSVLAKADWQNDLDQFEPTDTSRLLARYPDVVERATADLAPQLIVHYLLELASSFNHFYAENKIIGSSEENSRLALTATVAQVLKNGLWLLGIATPEKM